MVYPPRDNPPPWLNFLWGVVLTLLSFILTFLILSFHPEGLEYPSTKIIERWVRTM